MWIGADDIGCCHDQIESVMWIGKDVKGSFHVQFEIIYALKRSERILS
jgi:hypothetical protein